MRSIQVRDSYKIWSTNRMRECIYKACKERYGYGWSPVFLLNRSWFSMYVEWYMHNIGYWLTLPFIKSNRMLSYNMRLQHVDLEEH